MARIRYLAMLCADPAALAGFYRHNFGLDEARPQRRRRRHADRRRLQPDAVPQSRRAARAAHGAGLHHLGIAVDDVDAVVARYRARYPRGTVIAESGDLQHGEVRIYDPECNPVTLSQNEFRACATRHRACRASRISRSMRSTPRRSSISTARCSASASCSRRTRSRASEPGYRNKHVGDGHTNVAIQAFYSGEEGHEARFGIAHFGFLVPDSKAMAEQVAGRAAPPSRRGRRTARSRKSACAIPEGNGCDLSQRGWEVDTGKWVRADAA